MSALITIGPEPPDSPTARACLTAYFAEIAQRFDGGFDPQTANALGDLTMAPPTGLFLVARLEGRPVGCGGVKLPPDQPALIKRMWTAPDARGLGVARRLLEGLEAAARDAGFAVIRLDTNRALTEAHALYRRAGYAEVAAFSDEPYAHHWFEKRL